MYLLSYKCEPKPILALKCLSTLYQMTQTAPRFFRNSKYFSAETSFCWAFSISTMLRHSLNLFLREKAIAQSNEDKKKKIVEALQFLNHHDFHKRLRNGCNNYATHSF